MRCGKGYVNSATSRNTIILEYRSADGDAGRFPELASELVRLRVDLIVTRGTPAAQAAKTATETLPIVMAAIGEPLVRALSPAWRGLAAMSLA